jgi:SpoVK/Ycf46/Vps4 family AAA+-type ATPase
VELHDGIVLLTSNRPAALDDAFARRLRLRVRFDMPDHEQRTELWSQLLPPAVLDPQINYADVARAELSGGGIRAAALAARVLALAGHTAVGWEHLDLAVQTEMDKHGRRYDARTRAADTLAGATR